MASVDATRYVRVTAAECATHARILRDALAEFGVSPNPTSDLGEMLAALEWLGSFPPDAFQPDAAGQADRKRSFKTFVLYEQAKRTAMAVAWAHGIPGSEKIVKRLRKRLNRLETQDAEALDYFFELDVAHRLFKRGVPVSFGDPDLREPDLVLGSAPLRFGLECKRPRNIPRMRERIGDAADQVTRSGFPGMIVIGLEAILHTSDDPAKPTVTYLVQSPDELPELVDPIIDQAIAEARPDIEAAFRKGVRGILFCGLVTGIAEHIGDYAGLIFRWFRRPVSNPQSPEDAALLDERIFGRSLDYTPG